eukprot:gene2815-12570_t
MVVPTVILTEQQADYFRNSDLGSTVPNFAVDHFNSEKPLTPYNWGAVLNHGSMFVVVAAVFNNLLRNGGADSILNDIDLLVLDECHHTVKDHPYAKIMEQYCTLCEARDGGSGGGSLPIVIGITASPVGNVCPTKIIKEMEDLVSKLHRAKVYHISKDDDRSLLKYLPQPDQFKLKSEQRPSDQVVRSMLASALVCEAEQLCKALNRDALPSASPKAKEELEDLSKKLMVVLNLEHPGESTAMRQWITHAQKLSRKALAPAAPDPSRSSPRHPRHPHATRSI